jgi:hypothetical protein
MGLREEIQADIAAAFDGELSDAVVAIRVILTPRGTYDPSEGDVDKPALVEEDSRGVFDNYLELEVFNSSIEPSDTKICILQSEVSAKPPIGANIIRVSDEKIFRVIAVSVDPMNVMYECQSRSIHA